MLQIGALLTGCNAKNLPNLRNLAMELRKVCCHPVRHAASRHLCSLAIAVQICMLHPQCHSQNLQIIVSSFMSLDDVVYPVTDWADRFLNQCDVVGLVLGGKTSSSYMWAWLKLTGTALVLPSLGRCSRQWPSARGACSAALPEGTHCTAAPCISTLCHTSTAHVQVCHQTVMLQCSSCAMGWRRTLQ